MALHPHFPTSPHAVLDPSIRWFQADETLRETRMDNLLPPLVPELRLGDLVCWAQPCSIIRLTLPHCWGA